ncbi:MAG: hypothetical protein V7K76_14415 [Nostoc sp.]
MGQVKAEPVAIAYPSASADHNICTPAFLASADLASKMHTKSSTNFRCLLCGSITHRAI